MSAAAATVTTPRRSTSSTNNHVPPPPPTLSAANPNKMLKTTNKLLSSSSSSNSSLLLSSSSAASPRSATSKLDTGAVRQYSGNFNSKSSLAKLEATLNLLEGKVENHQQQDRDPSSSCERDEQQMHLAFVNQAQIRQQEGENCENEEEKQNSDLQEQSLTSASKQQQPQTNNNNNDAVMTKRSTSNNNNDKNGKVSMFSSKPQNGITSGKTNPSPVPPSNTARGPAPPKSGRASTANTDSKEGKNNIIIPGGTTPTTTSTTTPSSARLTTNGRFMRSNLLLQQSQQSQRSSSKTKKDNNNNNIDNLSSSEIFENKNNTGNAKIEENNSVSSSSSAVTSPLLDRCDRVARSVLRRQQDQENSLTSSPTTTNNHAITKTSEVQQFTEDSYPWNDTISLAESRVIDCKLKGAMEKHGTGSFIYSFPKTGFFACKRCHKKVASATSKFPAEGGYASFEKYCVQNLRCDLLLCSGSSASSSKELNETRKKCFPHELYFIHDATVGVSCAGCLANIGILHPIHAHLMVNSGSVVHCSVDKFIKNSNSSRDIQQEGEGEQEEEEDTIFAEVLSRRHHNNGDRPSSRLSNRGSNNNNRPSSRMSTVSSKMDGRKKIENDDDDDDEEEEEDEESNKNHKVADHGDGDDDEEDDDDDEFPEATASTVLFL